MFTALTFNIDICGQADENVSSLVDAWITVRAIEFNGERNRGIYIMKARGIKNSNRVREFLITSKGVELLDIVEGPQGVLVGSAREAYSIKNMVANPEIINVRPAKKMLQKRKK
jgi:circadian clock protein KaiC